MNKRGERPSSALETARKTARPETDRERSVAGGQRSGRSNIVRCSDIHHYHGRVRAGYILRCAQLAHTATVQYCCISGTHTPTLPRENVTSPLISTFAVFFALAQGISQRGRSIARITKEEGNLESGANHLYTGCTPRIGGQIRGGIPHRSYAHISCGDAHETTYHTYKLTIDK